MKNTYQCNLFEPVKKAFLEMLFYSIYKEGMKYSWRRKWYIVLINYCPIIASL